MATPVSGANSWLSIQGRLIFFRPEEENQHFELKEYGDYTIKVTPYAPEDVSLYLDDEKVESEHYGLWKFNPTHYAGLYKVTAKAPGQPDQETWLRVFPHKFTQKAYEYMKEELSRTAIDLLFHLNSPALERANYTSHTRETSALHDYQQVRRIIGEMRDIILRIRLAPHTTLHTELVQQKLQQLRRFSPEMQPVAGARVPIPARNGQAARSIPHEWMTRRSYLSYDSYENRLLKHFIKQQLLPKLGSIQERAEQEKEKVKDTYNRYHNKEDQQLMGRLGQAIEKCKEMRQSCLYWTNELFLQAAQPLGIPGQATQVLQKDPAYSRFYRLYLQFQQRLQTTIETEKYITAISLRRVSALYEMWSIFGVTRLVTDIMEKEGYQMTANSTFEITENLFHFSVKTNTASIVLEKGDARIEIKYEPYYHNIAERGLKLPAIVSTTINGGHLTPDMAIEVYKGGEPQTAS
ncbi:DUF2357 domain-containing protein [Dictyobacter kobayashii]|uniref:DUF2357 domain-containing protein n=1 Tax=Dictyobacter kobayashii TaxID=2014872 RepID=A0A402AX24_9CHLR|nr:DUF2357 domain-containing protein [Dictyobacter kobayashii]GCE23603.1 hypothetical protein KDK_74030 [Dictyobacter kobayashii]